MLKHTLESILTPEIVGVNSDATVREAIHLMREKRISCVLVLSDGVAIGIFTERNALHAAHLGMELDTCPIHQLMSAPVISQPKTASILGAFHILHKYNIRHIVVVDDEGNTIGVVSQTDLVQGISTAFHDADLRVSEVMNRTVATAPADGLFLEFVKFMAEKSISCLIVVQDRRGRGEDRSPPLGIVTERDVIRILDQQPVIETLTLADVMSYPVFTIDKDSEINKAIQLMHEKSCRRVVVTGPDNDIQGLLTQTDIVRGLRGDYIDTFVSVLAKMEQSESDYRSIVENAMEGIFRVSLDGRFLTVNPALARMHGFDSPTEMMALVDNVGTDLYCDPNDYETFYEALSVEGMLRNYEAKLRRKDGSSFWGNISARICMASDGVSAFIEGYLEDCTERKQAADALRDAARIAESANRAKSEFLTILNHEVRNPLTTILGMADLLMASKLDANQRYYVDLARQAGESLLGTINDIIDIVRFETGKIEIEKTSFSPFELVERIGRALLPVAEEKGLEFHWRVEPTLPALLRGDPLRIRHILTSLIGNAFKYTPQGSVTLTLERADGEPGQHLFRFRVRDTGIGISREKLDSLFELFSNGHAHPTREHGFVGLGLTLIFMLARKMRGTLSVASEIGQGSTFTLTLPLGDVTETVSIDAPKTDLLGLRALVVDNTPTTRFILRDQLASLGIHASMADSAEQASALLSDAPRTIPMPDVLLLDCHLPGQDGFTLARNLRASLGEKCPGIVMLSSGARFGDMTRLGQLGLAEFVQKPTTRIKLRRAIAEALGMVYHEPSAIDSALQAGKPLKLLVADDDPANRLVLESYLQRRPQREQRLSSVRNVHGGQLRRRTSGHQHSRNGRIRDSPFHPGLGARTESPQNDPDRHDVPGYRHPARRIRGRRLRRRRDQAFRQGDALENPSRPDQLSADARGNLVDIARVLAYALSGGRQRNIVARSFFRVEDA